MTSEKKITELHSECGASEPYALQVTDDSMEKEFPRNCIVIIDPTTQCKNGDYVFVEYDGVRWFRKFIENKTGQYLIPLNDLYPEIKLDNSYDIIGIVVQKNVNRKITHY
ncbi:MAG: peptidase [Gammaproteobacteria bacterium]|nr:peptidase [Gammaproteobacteria bacterium]|tara:strand:- start:72 stop:401 length:330 start_codon:yes stop_codon:yes gene_type:complete